MRKTWLIFINSLQRMRMIFGASVLIGLLICFITGLFSSITTINSPIAVGYIDHDGGAISADFANYATQHLGMELVEGDQATLNNELVEKHISAIVEIPAGFEQSVLSGSAASGTGALQVTYMDDYLNKVFLENYFEMYTGSVDMLAGLAGGNASTLANLLSETNAQTAEVTTAAVDAMQTRHDMQWIAFMFGAGFFLFVAALLVITLATIIYDDRANNTFKRVQASNVSAVSYVIGVCAAGFVCIISMIVVFLIFCAVSGFGEVIPLASAGILFAMFVLFCVAFSLACGLLFNSRNSILWGVLGVSILFPLMGGAFFPISYAPDFMQQLAHITPQFWFIDALYQIQAGQTDAWIVSSSVIFLFALLCFLVSGIRFANNKNSAKA
jgi:ABC-2 type transport system permease protein